MRCSTSCIHAVVFFKEGALNSLDSTRYKMGFFYPPILMK
jgi:hypothetical protein